MTDLFNYYVNTWFKNRIGIRNLLYYQIHLTTNCQNNCLHCYYRELPHNKTSFEINDLLYLLENIRKQANRLKLPVRVDFTGGDPFLYNELETVLKKCIDLKIPYGFKCNPEFFLNPSENIFSLVKKSSGVSLSIDGLRETHDKFRQKGSFDTTLKAIQTIKNSGIQLKVGTTISKNNVNNLIPLINFLLQEEIILDDFTWARYWSIENSSDILNAQELYTVFSEMEIYMRALFNTASFYYKTTNGRMIPKIMFGFKEHQWFPYLATKGILDPQLVEYIQTNENCINCTATKHFYIVDPDLSIYKCRKLPETKITFVNIMIVLRWLFVVL